MAWIFNRRILAILLCSLTLDVSAQSLGIGFNNYFGKKKSADYGFDVHYYYPLKHHALVGALEWRSIDWGNQINLEGGYVWNLKTWQVWSLRLQAVANIGMALFYPNSKFALGAGVLPEFKWQSQRRFGIGLQAGVRYSNCPSYEVYGNHRQWDLPVNIRVDWQLGPRPKPY